MRKNALIIGFVILTIFIFTIEIEMGKETPFTTLSIFGLGLFLWFTNTLPAAVTGILIMLLFALFGILSFEEAVSGLGHPVIWLVMAVLFLGVALENSGLDKRIAYKALAKFGKSENKIIKLFIILGFLFTFLIPNAMGRMGVLLPIAQGVIANLKNTSSENFPKALILTVTLVPYLTTITVFTGASGSIYALGLFESTLNYQWSYMYWHLVMLPITLASLAGLWLLLQWHFPLRKDQKLDTEVFQSYLKQMGPMKKEEHKLIFLYLFLIAGWVASEWHPLSISMLAVMALAILFFPGMNIIDWDTARKKVNWGVPILFASGLAIALSFEKGGVVRLLAENVLTPMQSISPLILSILLMMIIVIVRIGFTNFNAIVASTMPIVLTLGIESSANPIWLGMVYLAASSTSFLIPTQSIGSMTTYTLGFYTSRDFIKVGFPLTALIIIVTITVAFFYWPLLDLNIYE